MICLVFAEKRSQIPQCIQKVILCEERYVFIFISLLTVHYVPLPLHTHGF